LGHFLLGGYRTFLTWDLSAKAALQPTYLLLTGYISIPAVTATYGFALTATPQGNVVSPAIRSASGRLAFAFDLDLAFDFLATSRGFVPVLRSG
jgi:hypothetical protein